MQNLCRLEVWGFTMRIKASICFGNTIKDTGAIMHNPSLRNRVMHDRASRLDSSIGKATFLLCYFHMGLPYITSFILTLEV